MSSVSQMASPVKAHQAHIQFLTAKMVGAGAGNPTGLEGDATAATRTGTGTYVVTFPSPRPLDVRDVRVSLRQAASGDLFTTETYDEAAKTVTVTVKNGGAAFAEVDLTSSETLHVTLMVKTGKTY